MLADWLLNKKLVNYQQVFRLNLRNHPLHCLHLPSILQSEGPLPRKTKTTARSLRQTAEQLVASEPAETLKVQNKSTAGIFRLQGGANCQLRIEPFVSSLDQLL